MVSGYLSVTFFILLHFSTPAGFVTSDELNPSLVLEATADVKVASLSILMAFFVFLDIVARFVSFPLDPTAGVLW